MQGLLRLGMIGLDTSHVPAFAELLNQPDHPYHVPGGRITVAYPGVPSLDFAASYERVEKFTTELHVRFNVPIVSSAAEVAEQSDAVLLLAVDGRNHLGLLKEIAPYGKPVFVDKPFAITMEDAREMFMLAEQYQFPLMSCSSLRYAECLDLVVEQAAWQPIVGADCFGPMSFETALPGYFWYGIHTVEMLYRLMGRGCSAVTVISETEHDLLIGIWQDGRIGTARGGRTGNYDYGAVVHYKGETAVAEVRSQKKPIYAGLLEQIMRMFHSGKPDIQPEETMEIISFLVAANESKRTGKTIRLQ